MLGKRGARMEIETLKRSHLKRNIIIGVVVIAIISAVILTFTRAKYRVTESIPLVNGTINYSLADLNIIGLYIDGEEAIELDSSKNYTLDTSKSTCTYKDGTEIPDLSISYDSETGELQISPFTTKGTKCTLYFEEYIVSVSDIILTGKEILTRSSFSNVLTADTTGIIYQAEDDDGITYYFAGNPTDNWVQFGGFYWRIIRINGDGTIRLIYQGTSANTTGRETQIGTSDFNTAYEDNMYVGFKYTNKQVHGMDINSKLLDKLNSWYISSGLSNYADKIDINAGFCNDRTPYSGTGIGSAVTIYSAYTRLKTNKIPSFKCSNSSDLFTISSSNKGNKALQYPIGLITADEVAYAGGVAGTNNRYYYLYTGLDYWTISPYNFSSNGGAFVFVLNEDGDIDSWYYTNYSNGVRPVINLKADVQISSGTGTSTDPYVIS